jgi:cell division protein FtsB
MSCVIPEQPEPRNSYSQGSLWRRWDLHVHTPGSALRSNHPSWDDFLAALESAPPEICVIGATDYGSISGYERLKQEKANGRLTNLSLILPNVELRMTPHHHPGKGINVHLIFDVSDPDHVDCIKTELARLTYDFQKQPYGCSEKDLKRLGRAFKPNVKSDEEAYREGLNQFRPAFQTLRDWYEKSTWLVQNSIVVVDNGEGDGASNLKDDQGFKAERDQIYHFADAVFSASPADTAYFLGKKPGHGIEDLARRYGGLKACICGCDTSEPEKLFKPDRDRCCWIKADPTFEGLKQIIYEPEERVHIGSAFPEERDENRIVTRLSLGDHGKPHWLKLDEIPLNPGLVAIIGNKGTGKTALVDLIAYATGAWDQTAKTSFITKSEIHGLEISIRWKSGDESKVTLEKKNYNNSDQRTKYLSQQFVEDLCANNRVGEKLRAEIEGVIFQHLGSDRQLGASGFAALRSKRTNIVREERQSLWEGIQASIADYVELLAAVAELSAKEQRVKQLHEEREGLLAQIPKLNSEEQEKNAQALASARDRFATISSEIAALRGAQHDLEGVRSKVQRFQRTMESFLTEITQDLKPFNFDAAALASFKPMFRGDTKGPIDQKSAELTALIKEKQGTAEDETDKESLHGYQKLIDQLAAQSSLDQETRKRIESLQQRLRELAANLTSLEHEIKDIKENKVPQRDQKLATIFERYKDTLKTFVTEHEILTELYAPLSQRLSQSTDTERRLVFVIDRYVDLMSWAERGEDLIDHTKRGPYRQFGALHQKADELLLPHLTSGDTERLAVAIQEFLNTFSAGNIALSDQLKSGVSLATFYERLFSLQHISLLYGIKYNGIGLARLSPGTKGLVLLMLYLEMDENDRRPLLVDQPEENLDNESVYKTLRAYFRRAKRRRQIILVTHNPNLVVNTDADQVIVACATESEKNEVPTLSYTSGSLENSSRDPVYPGIRQKVCTILEGGDDAFRSRERRYSVRHR